MYADERENNHRMAGYLLEMEWKNDDQMPRRKSCRGNDEKSQSILKSTIDILRILDDLSSSYADIYIIRV